MLALSVRSRLGDERDQLGLDSIVSIYEPENTAAGAVMRRLGFTLERETIHPAHHVVLHVMSLSRAPSTRRETPVVQTHVVVAAVLLDGARVLLCHRSAERRWYPDVWDLPGGHVEPGEQPLDALRRELLEELGIEVEARACAFVRRILRPATDLDLSVFVVTAWSGTVENLQTDEHDDVAWFHADELPSLALADESYRPMLRALLVSR